MLLDKHFRFIVVFLAIIFVGGILPLEANPMVVGSGPDSSYLIIQSSMFSATLVYQYNYTYDSAVLLDGHDMLVAVAAADSLLSFDYLNYGDADTPNYFLSAITYDSVKVINNFTFPDFSYWAQWVSGGKGGDAQNPQPYADNVWAFGSGMSAPWRTLAPGSWDGYVYNDGSEPPSLSPIPEPGSVLLGGFGCLLLLLSSLRRWVTKKQRGL